MSLNNMLFDEMVMHLGYGVPVQLVFMLEPPKWDEAGEGQAKSL